jgi:hypothetical protein
MTHKLMYGVVLDRPRRAIHVVRVVDEILELPEIDDITEKMRDHVLSRRGEQAADVVLVQGNSRETLRLFGDAHAVTLVRAALFNASISWSSLSLD